MSLTRLSRAQSGLNLIRDSSWILIAVLLLGVFAAGAQVTGTVIDSSNSMPVASALVSRP